jgi:hypothetical protein
VSPVPDRYVVVVPANAPETLAYLTESFKNVRDVVVIAERRRRRTAGATAPVERRANRPTREAFGCILVRVKRAADEPAEPSPPLPPPATATSAPSPIQLRTLPLLREG